ncbi:MAG: DNA-processing protein DprA [Solirubrobacteraceae bacterium]
MSSPVEQAALVALLREGRRPWQVYAELVEETGSALHVLEHELERDDSPKTLFDLASVGRAANAPVGVSGLLDEAAVELAAWRGDGIEVVSVLDTTYPENLRAVHNHPPLLFVAGQLDLADVRAVAVVGSRAPTADGIAAAGRIARDLADPGYTVFSGLAAGIDTTAHNATLAAGGRTVAVVGTGLRHCYPPQNIELAQRIAREGALVSQFWPDSPPTRRSFPTRNAVMSGMTLGTVIVEASHTSGTRIQARLALSQGRPVFIHRSLLSQSWARELATRPGAYPFASAGEVLAVVERRKANEELTADERTARTPGR